MKKILFLLMMVSTMAFAGPDLTVIRIGLPGSVIETWTHPMSSRLAERGWNTQLIGFPDCQGAEQWIKDNPAKPVMYMSYMDHFALPFVKPDHPRLCPTLKASEQSLVAMPSRVYHNICGINKTFSDLKSMNKPTIGTWNHPTQVSVVKTLLKDLGVDARIVEFASAAQMIQSTAAKDLDFVVVSYENLVTNIGGQCFITTAPKELAKKQNKLSVFDVVKTPSKPGTGAVPAYVAYNTDIEKLQKDMAVIFNTAPEYTSMWSNSNIKSGIAAGRTSKQQWQEFNDYLTNFK